MSVASSVRQELLQGGESMELITNWEVFNSASLVFYQFQGLVGITTITATAFFKFNLGETLSLFITRRKRP